MKHNNLHCSICESVGHTTAKHGNYAVYPKIKAKGFPLTSKNYASAHEKANRIEKNAYPSGYEKMKKIDRNLPKDELAGKNTKAGRIEVSAKVPSKLRPEVAKHEKEESKALRKKK